MEVFGELFVAIFAGLFEYGKTIQGKRFYITITIITLIALTVWILQ